MLEHLPKEKYYVTYFDIVTRKRIKYMGGIGFSLVAAKAEIRLLEKQQDYYESVSFGRTRTKFRHEKIKFTQC